MVLGSQTIPTILTTGLVLGSYKSCVNPLQRGWKWAESYVHGDQNSKVCSISVFMSSVAHCRSEAIQIDQYIL